MAKDPQIKGKSKKELETRTKELDLRLKGEEKTRIAIMNILEDVDEARRKLAEEDIRKNELFNITSHELKTPLVPIKGYLDLIMREKYGNLTEKQKEKLQIIDRNVKRLAKLIDDILDIARLQAEKMKFAIEDMDPREIIDDSIDAMKSFAGKEKITLKKSIGKLPAKVKTDRNRVMQVVTNLLNNAIKFTPEHGMITARAYSRGRHWFIDVADTGVGISKKNQEKIFERFYQIDSTITRKYGGAGLGLAICKGIVEALGGAISVASKPGKGSTFTVKLPIKTAIKTGEVGVYGLTKRKFKEAGYEIKKPEAVKEVVTGEGKIKEKIPYRELEKKGYIKPIEKKIEEFF